MAAWRAMSAVYPSPDGGVPRPRTGQGSLDRSRRVPGRRGPAAGPPPSRQRVRRTRTWMLLLLLTPVVLAGISLLTFTTGGPSEPTVQPVVVPAGYSAITDADFGYSVPKTYTQNLAWTDQNGDFFYGEPHAFVAETLLVSKVPPGPRTRPPASFESFGQPDPVPYSVGDGRTVRVPGTAYGYEEYVTRPGGYRALALEAWERSSSTELWLLVRAPATVTRTVIASLRG